MAQLKKGNRTFQILLEFIIAAIFIAMGGTMYIYVSPFMNYLGKICLPLLAIAVVSLFFLKKPYTNPKQFRRGIIITAIICVYLIVFLLINPVNIKLYIVMLCQVCLLSIYVFICCQGDEIPGVIFRYSQLVTVVAAVSIVCWILFSLLRVVPPSGTVDSYWFSSYFTKPQITYFDIYFEPQKILFFGRKIVRNCAIFTEAPMFTWHLVISLLIELFVNKKLSWVRTVIICAAILSTISTMGYIWGIAAILIRIVLAILSSRKYRSLSVSVKVIIWIVAAAIIVSGAIACILLLKEKFATYSGSSRIDDFKYGFLGWMDNFWTGAGFGNRETIYMHRVKYADYGFSNGIMEVAAEGGVYLLICFVGPFVYGFVDAARKKQAGMAIFAVLVFVMAAITSSQYTYLMYFLQLFMLFGLMDRGRKEKEAL